MVTIDLKGLSESKNDQVGEKSGSSGTANE